MAQQNSYKLDIPTPEWAVPLLAKKRYKGAKGGRGSGKSHFFAEAAVELMIYNPDASIACVREIQKSLKYSVKKLIESKIASLGVAHLFDCQATEIKRKGGNGVIVFLGLQDHTADSIKSLESFDLCWIDEARNITNASLQKLLPTFRKKGSEVWFSWNPDQPDDAVERFFAAGIASNDPDFCLVHVNFLDNPFCPDETKADARRWQSYDPDTYEHVWLGGFNVKNEAQIFCGKYVIDEFEPGADWTDLYGLDWGFSQDPTAAVQIYVHNEVLYIRREAGKIGLELDDTASFVCAKIPGIEKHVIRADCARPESISHVKRKGLPRIEGVDKWKGSVEDGIAHIRSYKRVVIHPDCKATAEEFRLYAYKVKKETGEVTSDIVDKHNHYIDAIRYAVNPLIQRPGRGFFDL